jgi:Ca2+-transporting ATPase
VDPIDRDVMKRRPREKGQSVWKGMGLYIFEYPIIVTFAILAAFEMIVKQGDVVLAQTMAFTMLVMAEKMQVFSCRSLERPVWREMLKNKWIVYTFLLTVFLHAWIIYDPLLNEMFSVKPLSLENWAVVAGMSAFIFIYLEVRKWMGNRKK